MTDFSRKLNLAALSPAGEVPDWFRDMVRLTRPAGRASEPFDASDVSKTDSVQRPGTLRVAIRNGYVNFYCGGQSVGKVYFGKTLRGEVHYKYLTNETVPGKDYVSLKNIKSEFPQHGGLEKWIERTHCHQGVEKLFVDRVYGANPALIDLEAALPGAPLIDKKTKKPVINPETGKERVVAPRIDLVALEKEPEGKGWRLVFWEAKTVDDSRIRSKSTTPEVIEQLKTYHDWFLQKGIETAIRNAYYETCKTLVGLEKWATDQGYLVRELDVSIKEIAEDRSLLVGIDPSVRLLIDNRSDDERFCTDHLWKLGQAGICVHMVTKPEDNRDVNFSLPAKAVIEKAMKERPYCR